MRELGRDVSAADEHDPARQTIEVQEFGAGSHMFLARNAELLRCCAHGEQNEAAFQHVPIDIEAVGIEETRAAPKGLDTGSCEALLARFRNGLGERPLEADQLAPLQDGLAGDTLAEHPAGMVDRFRRADQNLFRIAAAQSAGAAERLMIDDRHPPPRPNDNARRRPMPPFRCR